MGEERLIGFIKEQPRSIKEVSDFLGKSWGGTESHLKRIRDRTGLIDIKIFRKGSHGALKVVYYTSHEISQADELRKHLFDLIKAGREKDDFDFLEVYQFVDDEKKSARIRNMGGENDFCDKELMKRLKNTKKSLLCFSGNLSFLTMEDGGESICDIFEQLLRKKVHIRILMRVTIPSLKNLDIMRHLMRKFPDLLEIRHSFQPLRGFIFDDEIARFKFEEEPENYRAGELSQKVSIMYELQDEAWVLWLQNVFWNIYRNSIDHKKRVGEMNRIM